MITSEIKVCGKIDLLNACAAALDPEQEFKTDRATYNIKQTKDLIITIEAKDLIAFRAVMNSITSLLGIVSQNFKIKEVDEKNG